MGNSSNKMENNAANKGLNRICDNDDSVKLFQVSASNNQQQQIRDSEHMDQSSPNDSLPLSDSSMQVDGAEQAHPQAPIPGPQSPNDQQQPFYDVNSKEYVKVVSPGIGVIGLRKTGRSMLIGAIAGGVWPKSFSDANPVNTKSGVSIYKLSYPNNGFIKGSIDENYQLCKDFIDKSQLKMLTTLILAIDGDVREEDVSALSLAKEYGIKSVIVRTKLDEWLDSSKHQSKKDYVQKDKQYVIDILKKSDIDYSKADIFNVSALAIIKMAQQGVAMKNYQQDEQALMERLNLNDMPLVKANDAGVVVAGLKSVGKSTIINGMKKQKMLTEAEEIGYDSKTNIADLFTKIDGINAKLHFIVVAHTVDGMDVKLAEHLQKTGKKFAILLTKSDEHIDNLKKQGNYDSHQNYMLERREATRNEIGRLVTGDVSMFIVSGFVLFEILDHNHEMEETILADFVKKNL